MSKLDDLTEETSKRNKTDWATLATWVGVALVVVGAVLWPRIETDHRHEKFHSEISDSFVGHIRDGHPERIDDKLEAIFQGISEMNRWIHQHESSISAASASSMERLQSVERKVFGRGGGGTMQHKMEGP